MKNNSCFVVLETAKRSVDMLMPHLYTDGEMDWYMQRMQERHQQRQDQPQNIENLIDITGMLSGGNDMPRKWVTVGTDENGQPIKKNVYGKTEDELQAKIAMTLIHCGMIPGQEVVKKEKTPFSALAEEWLEIPKKKKREINTLESYKYSLEGRILPYFGRLFIEDITCDHVQAWIDSMPELAKKTVQHHMRILRAILDRAVKKGLIPTNPARDEDIFIQNDKESKRTAIPKETMRKIIEGAGQLDSECKKIIMILTCTGMRRGELLALRWKDIDFAEGWIHIRHGAKLTKAARIGTTKSKSSVRDIPLLDTLRDVLEPLRGNADELVIGGKYKPICENTFRKRMKHIGTCIPEMEEYTAHYFRHTFLSMLAAEGMDVATVQRWAGHKKATTTLDVYYHDLIENVEKSAKIAENWMNIHASKEENMHLNSVA